MRKDGTFGFEEFRRDIEDSRGWFPIGFYGERRFQTAEGAFDAAILDVDWLKDVQVSYYDQPS